MKDELKFWKRLSLILMIAIVVITSISWSYYGFEEATLSDVCEGLDAIEDSIDRLSEAVDSIYYSIRR